VNIDKETTARLLAKVKPWVAVATVLALVMLGYSAYTGIRYRSLSSEVSELETSIAAHDRTLSTQLSGDEALLAKEAEEQSTKVQATIDRFSGPVASSLLAQVANAAESNGLQPNSLAGSTSDSARVGDLDFSTDGVAMALTGNIEDLSDFLDTLREGFPGTTLIDMRVVGLEGKPSIQAEIVIHHSPRLASTEAAN
jgi:hypothetical protein